jgi:hypothetical protein
MNKVATLALAASIAAAIGGIAVPANAQDAT